MDAVLSELSFFLFEFVEEKFFGDLRLPDSEISVPRCVRARALKYLANKELIVGKAESSLWLCNSCALSVQHLVEVDLNIPDVSG